MKPIYLKKDYGNGLDGLVSLSRLMFLDYRVIYREANRVSSSFGSYSRRINWLIMRGQDRKIDLTCPICGEKEVAAFGYGINGKRLFFNKEALSCIDSGCRSAVKERIRFKRKKVDKIKFSTIYRAGKDRTQRRMIGEFYKKIFGLPKIMSDKEALHFFKK